MCVHVYLAKNHTHISIHVQFIYYIPYVYWKFLDSIGFNYIVYFLNLPSIQSSIILMTNFIWKYISIWYNDLIKKKIFDDKDD